MTGQQKRAFSISFDAMDRMGEEFLKTHPSWAAQAAGTPCLKAGRSQTDEQLLAKLRALGIDTDRESLAQRVRQHPSAEALSKALIREAGTLLPDTQEADWVWIGIAVLWERWFPDEPSFEILSGRIAHGYESLEKKNPVAAAEVWLRAWDDVMALARKLSTCEMTAFDEAFGGYQCVFNWCQDVSDALSDAGRADSAYLRKGIAYAESLLATFRDLDPLIAQNTRRSMAEAHFTLGETERGNALFRAWLTDDPQWGWGWIGWSDCHAWPCFGVEDRREAGRILREGLAVPDVRDREEILDRLQDLCADGEDAIPAELPRSTPAPAMAEPARHAVGRNEPCPCGSGKKYKKCCLAKDEAARRG